ncbi:MAG: hypothetical protein V4813_07510 [Gemmatimonadota bacterium]
MEPMPCNRKPIHIGTLPDGTAQIRVLDRQTGVAARMEPAVDDRVHHPFMTVTEDLIQARIMNLDGDTTIASARRR